MPLLGDLVSVLLAPYDDMGAFSCRIRVSVPHMAVGQVAGTTLAMGLHELATNSPTYGALSNDEGTWMSPAMRRGNYVDVVWTEHGDLLSKRCALRALAASFCRGVWPPWEASPRWPRWRPGHGHAPHVSRSTEALRNCPARLAQSWNSNLHAAGRLFGLCTFTVVRPDPMSSSIRSDRRISAGSQSRSNGRASGCVKSSPRP